MYTVYVKYVYLQGDILLQWSDVNYKYKNIFLNEKMKPTFEPNQDKITTPGQINSELPNESIALIPPTSPRAPSQEFDYLTNASTALIPPRILLHEELHRSKLTT